MRRRRWSQQRASVPASQRPLRRRTSVAPAVFPRQARPRNAGARSRHCAQRRGTRAARDQRPETRAARDKGQGTGSRAQLALPCVRALGPRPLLTGQAAQTSTVQARESVRNSMGGQAALANSVIQKDKRSHASVTGERDDQCNGGTSRERTEKNARSFHVADHTGQRLAGWLAGWLATFFTLIFFGEAFPPCLSALSRWWCWFWFWLWFWFWFWCSTPQSGPLTLLHAPPPPFFSQGSKVWGSVAAGRRDPA